MDSKWKEIKADFFDDVEEKHHVDAWVTANVNEGGKVIAKIDKFGNVEYIDETAKTDTYAKMIIEEVVSQRLCAFVMGNYLILPMTIEEKLELIEFFYINYYHTDQNVTVFAEEFYYLISEIHKGKLPIRLDYLSDYKEELAESFPRFRALILQYVDDSAADDFQHKESKKESEKQYLLYGTPLIENDATMKDFAASLIKGVPDDDIKELPADEYADEFMERVETILKEDISRTDIDYEELMQKYRCEIGDLLYEMENHGCALDAYPVHFFGKEAEESFNEMMRVYILLNLKNE